VSLELGRRLKIRAIVHVAGEPIPYFWPMRTFIHHNPLYGLEHLPFEQAVAMGERLFHARGFLPRALQQRSLKEGKVDRVVLADQMARFLAGQPDLAGLDLQRLLTALLTDVETPVGAPPALADAADVHAALNRIALPSREIGGGALAAQVGADMPPGQPLYAMVDSLFGTEIGATLDELVIKSCLDFFDEGQSVWQMPGREQGLFAAWSAVARRNLRLFIRGLHIKRIVAVDDTPEAIISHVMDELGVPEDDWMNHFTCELTRLHGWAGFIRWRAGAKHYHWARHYPADLVDYLAIRLVLGLALLREHEARHHADALRRLADRAGRADALQRLAPADVARLTAMLDRFEREEGRMWLAAREAHYMGLLHDIDLAPPAPREKRPFAQVMFCIDVRSERIRRHLEKVGDYQTFGIAGFFGVPVSFIGLDKGSETHLCPVVASPKNVVLELAIARSADDEALVSTLEQVLHELKASVLSPFITVEAIGLLFGLDMFGKSLAPLAYNRWRQRLHPDKPDSRLLLDKLSREQAESIIRSLQRALIVKSVGRELGIPREAITDEMVRELRETALGNQERAAGFAAAFALDAEAHFIARLQNVYRINRGYAQIQLERLGRIGFTLDEQVLFVGQALHAIGLTEGFSRFVLLAGHGSTSENNPYESALDCGACGGNHGIINARVLAQIANKAAVRARLREQGIAIPDDAWFVPAFHNTTTDELHLYDLDLMPPSHLVYTERLSNGLQAASRLCAAERMATLEGTAAGRKGDPASAYRLARRNAMDWSQVRPEWGLARNAAFVIGRRHVTGRLDLEGRVFLHSYDYRCDPKGRLLENILAGPLVVGQWINMEHYFSAVDNAHYGSGSKVYHNIAGRFGVMTGNLSDLRPGLPAQTVLKDGAPYHEPLRLLTVIEAPFAHARAAIEGVVKVRNLVDDGWLRMAVVDPETLVAYVFENGAWQQRPLHAERHAVAEKELAL
jgi:hypothetical protein